MNLYDFYETLPQATAPKSEFVRRLAERTGKKEATVRLWIKNKTKPDDPKDLEILSEETGIEKEKLFAE
jgi:hypothetical protein